jgi:hypothetical protein
VSRPAALRRPWIALAAAACSLHCVTDWESHGTLERAEQTQVFVRSDPDAEVRVDGVALGRTPLAFPLSYRGFDERFERRASYWRTEPWAALFISLWSLGLYLPFSFIPVDQQERVEPTGRFAHSRFVIRLEQEGYQPWEQVVELAGEESLEYEVALLPERAVSP